jgi:hypothetical protein
MEVLTKEVESFESLNELLNQNTPVVVLNYMKHWKALDHWNLAYFQACIGPEQTVKVCCMFLCHGIHIRLSSNREPVTFLWHRKTQSSSISSKNGSARKLIQLIWTKKMNSWEMSSWRYACLIFSFIGSFLALECETGGRCVSTTVWLCQCVCTRLSRGFILILSEKGRLWIGSAGHHSHLHYDGHPGFLCCIEGTKEVWLYEPNYHVTLIDRYLGCAFSLTSQC